MTNKYEILFFMLLLLIALSAAVMCVDFVVGELQSSGLIEALTSHRIPHPGM